MHARKRERLHERNALLDERDEFKMLVFVAKIVEAMTAAPTLGIRTRESTQVTERHHAMLVDGDRFPVVIEHATHGAAHESTRHSRGNDHCGPSRSTNT